MQIGYETKGLDAALRDVNNKSRDIAKELRQVENLLKFNPHDTEVLGQKQKLLGDQVAATADKLNRLKEVQSQVNEQFRQGDISEEQHRAFQREIIKTESQLKNYEKQLRAVNLQNHEFNQRMQETGKKLQDTGKQLTDVGKTLSTRLTAPLLALGAVAAKSAIDFESAFTGVRKTVEATEAEFASLARGIRDMAREIPASAVEISGVAQAAGQLGIANDHILSFTRTMIDLGESTNMSAETAAASLARLANITQMSQADFDRLGSTVVRLGNNLATTESEIVDMGLRLAGAGKQIGMTEAEILSFAGALSSVGIAAEAGGSAFSKVMINMQLAAETGSDSLHDFAAVAGMSADNFAKAFQENASEALVAFIGGLQRAEEQGSSAIKVLDDIGITEVRMRDALLRAAGAGELFADSLRLGTEAWEDNMALTQEAAQRYATTEAQLAVMRNRLQEVAITFGEILLPPLLSVVNKIGEFADHIANLDPALQRTFVVVGALVAAVGPVLLILGQIVTSVGVLLPALGALAAFISKTLIPAIMGISLPAVATAGAIAALVVVAYEVYRAWEEVKAALLATWELLKASAVQLSLNMALAFEEMKRSVIGAVNEILERLSVLENLPFGLGDEFTGLKASVSEGVDGSKQKIEELQAALEANSVRMAEALDGTKVAFGDLGAKVAEDVQAVIRAITGQTEVIVTETEEQVTQVEATQRAQTAVVTEQSEERTQVISKEAQKQAEERAKFEEQWNQKLFALTATRLEQLEAEYNAAITLAEKLEADTTDIEKYFDTLREQYKAESQGKRLAFEQDWNQKLLEVTSEGAKARLLALEREERRALERAEELEADRTAIVQHYAVLREQILEEETKAEEKAWVEREALIQSWRDRLFEATADEEALLRWRAEKQIEAIQEQKAEEIALAKKHGEDIAAIADYWAHEEQQVWDELHKALNASEKERVRTKEDLETKWQVKLEELTSTELENRLRALEEEKEAAIKAAQDVGASITSIEEAFSLMRQAILDEEAKKEEAVNERKRQSRESFEERWNQRLLEFSSDRLAVLEAEYQREFKLAEELEADTTALTELYETRKRAIQEESQKAKEELAQGWLDKLFELTATEEEFLRKQADDQVAYLNQRAKDAITLAEGNAELILAIQQATMIETERVYEELNDKLNAEDKERQSRREALEEKWREKVAESSATRLELLRKEYDRELELAKELDANTADIKAHYEGLIRQIEEETHREREKIAQAWQDRLFELSATEEQLLQKRAEDRIESLRKQAAEEIALLEGNAEAIAVIEQALALETKQIREDLNDTLKSLKDAEEKEQQDRLKSWQDRLFELSATEKEILRKQAQDKIAALELRMEEEVALAEGHAETILAIEQATALEIKRINEDLQEALDAPRKAEERDRKAFEEEWRRQYLRLIDDREALLQMDYDKAIERAKKVGADLADVEAVFSKRMAQIAEEIADEQKSAWEKALDAVQSPMDRLVSAVTSAADSIMEVGKAIRSGNWQDVFLSLLMETEAFAKAMELIGAVLHPVVTLFDAVLKPIINGVLGLWNGIIDALASISIFGWKPFGGLKSRKIGLVGEGDSDSGSDSGSDRDRGGSGGRQVSEITGPTRDLFADLLAPLAHFAQLVAPVQDIRNLLYERLPNFNTLDFAGVGGGVTVVLEPGAVVVSGHNLKANEINDKMAAQISRKIGEKLKSYRRGNPDW